MQTEKCYTCGGELRVGDRDADKFREFRVELVDKEGRYIGATAVKKCMKCAEKEDAVKVGDKVIPKSQARLFQ